MNTDGMRQSVAWLRAPAPASSAGSPHLACNDSGMKRFLLTLPRNVAACFRGRMIMWHIIAILLTVLLVTTGLDWSYFTSTRGPLLRSWMFPAVRIGGVLPILLPLSLLALGSISNSLRTAQAGWAIGQAEVIGGLVAASYKAITGRVHPPHGVGVDLSHTFRFGLLRGGVFWGWPSSRTTIAFAMAITVFTLFRKQRWLGYVAIATRSMWA